jgi:hypothetical protein
MRPNGVLTVSGDVRLADGFPPAWSPAKKKNARRGGRSAGVRLFSNAEPGRRVVRRTVRAERGRRFAPTEFLC